MAIKKPENLYENERHTLNQVWERDGGQMWGGCMVLPYVTPN